MAKFSVHFKGDSIENTDVLRKNCRAITGTCKKKKVYVSMCAHRDSQRQKDDNVRKLMVMMVVMTMMMMGGRIK